MARVPGTSKRQDVAKGKRRCPGCGQPRPLVHAVGNVYACHSCREFLLEVWEREQRR